MPPHPYAKPASAAPRQYIGQEEANPYTTKANETLTSITKKITGSTDDWKLLYKENKTTLGDVFESSDTIPEGTKLTLPKDWVNNSSYNIVQEL